MSKREGQAGYALIVVLLLLALLAIAFTAAIPRALIQGQRESEEELIFRGEQYRRAIGLFNRKFGRLPLRLEELVRTNDLSFLRRPWPDPMSPSGEWRLIRVGPSGELIGSVTGGRGLTPQAPSAGGQAAGGSAQGQAQMRTRSRAESRTPSASSGRSGSGTSPYPIIGVASTSTDRSIKVYNDFQQYNEWEFIYDPVQDAQRTARAGGTPPGGDASQPPGGQTPAPRRPPR